MLNLVLWSDVVVIKFKILNSRWRTDAILENIVFGSGWSDFHEIFTRMQNQKINDARMWKFFKLGNTRWRTITILKMVISPYFSAMLSKYGIKGALAFVCFSFFFLYIFLATSARLSKILSFRVQVKLFYRIVWRSDAILENICGFGLNSDFRKSLH